MEHGMKALLAVAILAMPFGANAAIVNVFQNPGFESGVFTPWAATDASVNPDPWVTADQAHSGTYSAAAYGDGVISQTIDPLPTGRIFQLSFWVKNPNAFVFDSYILSYQDGSRYSDFFFFDNPSSDWFFVDLTDKLANGKKLTGFSIWGTSPGPTYFDDFSMLIRAPEPGTLALLGLGLLGLALGKVPRSRSG